MESDDDDGKLERASEREAKKVFFQIFQNFFALQTLIALTRPGEKRRGKSTFKISLQMKFMVSSGE